MKKTIVFIIITIFCLTKSFGAELKDLQIIKINESKEDFLIEPNSINIIDSDTYIITDFANGFCFVINSSGDIISKVMPPLKFVDSIRYNCIPASVFRGKYYRFLTIDELTYPPNHAKSGQRYSDDEINSFIERKVNNVCVINDSTIAMIMFYELFVQNMDPNTDAFSRGGENKSIIGFYNIYTNNFIGINYIKYRGNLFPRPRNTFYDSNSNAFLTGVHQSSDNNIKDSIPLIIKFNDLDPNFQILYNLPHEMNILTHVISLLNPTLTLLNEKHFCTFKIYDRVLNLTDNTSFDIVDIPDNTDYIKTFDRRNLSVDKLNFLVESISTLLDEKLLLAINTRIDKDNWEFQLHEYSTEGELIKKKNIPADMIGGKIKLLKGITNSNIIVGIQYDEVTEEYSIFKFRWQ